MSNIKDLQIGQQYILDNNNPFSNIIVTVLDLKDGYVKYQFNGADIFDSSKETDFLRIYQLHEIGVKL